MTAKAAIHTPARNVSSNRDTDAVLTYDNSAPKTEVKERF